MHNSVTVPSCGCRRAGQEAFPRVGCGEQNRLGVSNGTRTRDILDHNQVLYQLSYTHHDVRLAERACLS